MFPICFQRSVRWSVCQQTCQACAMRFVWLNLSLWVKTNKTKKTKKTKQNTHKKGAWPSRVIDVPHPFAKQRIRWYLHTDVIFEYCINTTFTFCLCLFVRLFSDLHFFPTLFIYSLGFIVLLLFFFCFKVRRLSERKFLHIPLTARVLFADGTDLFGGGARKLVCVADQKKKKRKEKPIRPPACCKWEPVEELGEARGRRRRWCWCWNAGDICWAWRWGMFTDVLGVKISKSEWRLGAAPRAVTDVTTNNRTETNLDYTIPEEWHQR